jgi:hypothetical protein
VAVTSTGQVIFRAAICTKKRRPRKHFASFVAFRVLDMVVL